MRSINVENLNEFVPDETVDGFLASSGIRVSFTTVDEETTEGEYIANYFVSPGPVYRTESGQNPTKSTSNAEAHLIQCGAE